MLVVCNVLLNDAFPASEPTFTEFGKTNDRVHNATFEQSIKNAGVAAQERGRGLVSFQCVLDILKVMLFHAAQLGTRNSGAAAKVCKVDFLQRELLSLFNHHLLYGLRHSWIHGCKIRLFHDASFHRELATLPV